MVLMKHLLVWLLLLFLIFSGTRIAQAQNPSNITPSPVPTIEYTLPYPGILPTHPLYFLKESRDKILIFFTREPMEKSQLYLLFADKNLVMGQMLWEQDNKKSLSILTQGENYLLNSILAIEKEKKIKEIDSGRVDKIEISVAKHEEILRELLSSATREEQINSLNSNLKITYQAKQNISALKENIK